MTDIVDRSARIGPRRAPSRTAWWVPIQLAAALTAGVVACDSPVNTASPARIVLVKASKAPAPLVRNLSVSLDQSYGTRVEYWSADGPRLRVTSEVEQPTHELVLARLRPATTYQYEVHATGAAGDGVAVPGSFTTDSLPDGLAVLDFEAEGTPTRPLTLLETVAHEGGDRGVVIVDSEGEVVWYSEEGPVGGTARRENGNLVIGYGNYGIVEVTPDGEVVAEVPQQYRPHRELHHDVITTPWNTVLFIAFDTRSFEGRPVSGEAIWEWNPDNGALDRRWSSWDHMSPATDWGVASNDNDWLHANSISLGPTGNILMSLRFLDQVISIAPDYSALEWRLGGINADVVVSGEDVFVGQHTASELAPVNGRRRVLLFDNGPVGRGFSRAQELELDLEAGTATTVWQFRPTPDNFSFITSLARRLPNGNTFVAFGAGPGVLASFGPVEAMEVDPAGEVRFRLEIGGPTVDESFVLYRARPISSIAGEEVVE
jgi:hypothetical protein